MLFLHDQFNKSTEFQVLSGRNWRWC